VDHNVRKRMQGEINKLEAELRVEKARSYLSIKSYDDLRRSVCEMGTPTECKIANPACTHS